MKRIKLRRLKRGKRLSVFLIYAGVTQLVRVSVS